MSRVAVMPCNEKTTRCGDARDYNSELAACCRAHVVREMKVTAEFWTARKVPWWLDYGALLGAVRNPMTTWSEYSWLPQEGRDTAGPAPGIIPHDKDADVGVTWDGWALRNSFKRYVEQSGLYLHQNIGRHSCKVRLSFKNHTNVDLFFWRETGPRSPRRNPPGIMYREKYARVDDEKGREFHRDLLFPLTTVEWEGMTLPAPRDPEAFLQMRYGPNWRTPVPANTLGHAVKARLGSVVDGRWEASA